MPVCLFDIDGTLLNSGGAGQAAMEHALEEVFGITGPTEGIGYAGRTDRAITTDMLRYHNVEPTEDVLAGFMEVYLAQLPHELSARPGLVLPGVGELLEQLSQHSNVMLGLLTGNFRRGAEVKLNHFGLLHYFEHGGFGDRHRDRDDVARVAASEVRAAVGDETPVEFLVIGDTPADIQCGRAIDAVTIAVATGVYSRDDLAATSPDHLFDDFSDVSRVVSLLSSGEA